MTAHDLATLETTIESAFEARDSISTDTRGEIRDAYSFLWTQLIFQCKASYN